MNLKKYWLNLNFLTVLMLASLQAVLFPVEPQNSKTLESPIAGSCEGLAANQALLTDGFYWCDASLWQVSVNPTNHAITTNFFAILQQNLVGEDSNWMRAGEMRFFKLLSPVPPGDRYFAHWVGTNLTFRLVPNSLGARFP
ncbi:MAG: hypothetical protein V4467_04210 [Patescibacteria group bacterium]